MNAASHDPNLAWPEPPEGPTPLSEDWHPADIKAALEKKSVSFAAIARREGLKRRSPADVLRRGWRRMEAIVAEILGVSPEDIWPSRYAKDFRPAGNIRNVAEGPGRCKGVPEECDFPGARR